MINSVSTNNVRPCIFHRDGSCSTYQRFFSRLRTKLDTDINTEVSVYDLVCSDEEKAILKAISQSFPSAQQLLCQCRLEENVCQHLQKKIGVPEKERNDIISLIFGKEGLVNCKDQENFELACLSLSNTFLETAPNFVTYFENSHLFNEYVIMCSKPSDINKLDTFRLDKQ